MIRKVCDFLAVAASRKRHGTRASADSIIGAFLTKTVSTSDVSAGYHHFPAIFVGSLAGEDSPTPDVDKT